MTDLEMTRLCAEAMGLALDDTLSAGSQAVYCRWSSKDYGPAFVYAPLTNDAQMAALVKKFGLNVETSPSPLQWAVYYGASFDDPTFVITENADLNRAIVECVARMQEDKGK